MIQSINQAGGGQGGGGGDDEKVKVSANDTTEGYLNGKLVAGTNVTLTENNNGGNETLTITATDTNDAAKVSANDTTAGFLNGKLVAGTNITFTENNDGSNETLTIAASGLTGFTASQNTASPNNTVNASRLLVDATSTNADAVIQPKGTGAFQLQLANNAASGGDKRGTSAIDLQISRNLSNNVASGNYSVIGGGHNNRASGGASVVFGGTDSVASGANSCVGGGQTNVASGLYSTISGGDTNTASANYATIPGGSRASASRYGQYSYASGQFGSQGDCQYERYILRRSTTDATQTQLSCDGGAPAATTRIGIANDSTYTFTALVTARRTDADNESAGYKIEGVIDNNAGTTDFVGTPTVTVLAEDTAAWDVVVEADNTNDALVIKVTGEANKTIRWGAVVELMKVSG